MSDLYIPGVKSRFGTEELVENLMKLERVPRERAEKNVENHRESRATWQDVGRRISGLREAARTLYSFQNPFNDRIGNSQDESVLSATATRQADEQERNFTVEQLASADRFLSNPLSTDYSVPAGDYRFTIGEREISFPYRGGSLQNFIDTVNRRGGTNLKASLIGLQPGTRSLLIESLITGSQNRLGFDGAALELAIETGMAKRVDSREEAPSLDPQSLSGVSRPHSTDGVSLSEGTLRVAREKEARIPLSKPFQGGEELTLSYEVRAIALRDSELQEPTRPEGPSIPAAGSVQYGGITIENAPLSIDIPAWQAPPPPPRVDSNEVLHIRFSDGTHQSLPAVPVSDSFTRHEISLSSLPQGKTISSIDILNRNTHREVEIRDLKIHDPAASGSIRPLNPINTARDAELSIDGIKLTRPSNSIDDLIPGVTIRLNGLSSRPVKLSIEPDLEGAKNSIISLVGTYNRLMAEINVLLRNDENILRELDYLDSDEQEEMREKLGYLQGDSSLNQLRSSMQTRASSTYPTMAERDLALLAQIGISTNAAGRGQSSGYDASRLRGYLEIDEKKLDEALADNIKAVAQLFGNDTDEDRIIDSGFAYEIDRLARAWTETGGLLAIKTSGIDMRIAAEERRIENLDTQLARKEQELKRQYGMMEGALNSMERNSQSIEQFNSNNSSKK